MTDNNGSHRIGMNGTLLGCLFLLGLLAILPSFLAAQVLKPVPSDQGGSGPRQVRVIALGDRAFEPKTVTVKPGLVTFVVRDYTGAPFAEFELRRSTTSGNQPTEVLSKHNRGNKWTLSNEVRFTLAPGEYDLGIAGASWPTCRIKVVAQ